MLVSFLVVVFFLLIVFFFLEGEKLLCEKVKDGFLGV